VYLIFRRRGRLTDEGKSMHCCISSWVRTSDNAIPIRLKCGANYQNGRLASLQAVDGYDGPIFRTPRGMWLRVQASSFFGAQRQVITPPTSADILESITRVTLMQLFKEQMGLTGGSRRSIARRSWPMKRFSAAAITRSPHPQRGSVSRR
jgi:branched-subunit amino acid aminotransferase/4-amino-4-deoxychorismate lyase